MRIYPYPYLYLAYLLDAEDESGLLAHGHRSHRLIPRLRLDGGLRVNPTMFPVSVLVGAAVPAAVCRWGLCSLCPGVGRCLSGVNISSVVVPCPKEGLKVPCAPK